MRFNKYFTLIVAAFALAACDKNNDELNIDETKDTPITILSAGVADLSTRAITDNKLVGTADAPVKIGVFITDATNKRYNYDNVDYTHNGESWSGGMYYEGSGSTQQISAYYPYTENISDDGFTVTADGTTDYLVASPVSMPSNEVTLTMKHALAKLVLKATFGSEMTDKTISKVEVGSMYASGKLKISDNSWDNLSEATATLTMTNNEVLVIPMASCNSFPITITMEDGSVFKTDVNLSSVESKLEAGTQYNIKLQIGQDLVALDGITASPWTSEDGGALGTE